MTKPLRWTAGTLGALCLVAGFLLYSVVPFALAAILLGAAVFAPRREV